MRVRMKVTISGTRNGQDWPKRGDVGDFPADEAKELIARDFAEAVDDEPAVETATLPDNSERAVKKATPTRKTGLTKGNSGLK